MGTNRDPQTGIMERDHGTLKPKRVSNLSPKGPRNPSEEEVERLLEPERMKDAKETRPLSQHGQLTCELKVTEAACTGLPRSAPDVV